MEELVGETFFKCLEYGSSLSYWLIWWERNTRTFEDTERHVDLLKYMLVGTLFQWSRIWDLQCISIYDFLLSVCISSRVTCICFKHRVFIIMNTMYFSCNKTLITYQKKKLLINQEPKSLTMKLFTFCRICKPREK